MSDERVPTLAGRLELSQTTAEPGGELAYIVVNSSDVTIWFGAAHTLDRFDGVDWERVDSRERFRAWGRGLSPGDRFGLTARLPEELTAGTYRLRKRLQSDMSPYPGHGRCAQAGLRSFEAIAEFAVTLR